MLEKFVIYPKISWKLVRKSQNKVEFTKNWTKFCDFCKNIEITIFESWKISKSSLLMSKFQKNEVVRYLDL